MHLSTIALFAAAFFAALMLIQFLPARKFIDLAQYDRHDLCCNLIIGAGNVVVGSLTIGIMVKTYELIYQFRILNIDYGIVFLLLLFFVDDLCYYIFHRASHSIRLW